MSGRTGDPTFADAIQEAQAWLTQIEGFEADTRRMAKEADAEGKQASAVKLHAAANDWLHRFAAMKRAVDILRAVAPHEEEVRALIADRRAGKGRRRPAATRGSAA
ncbi:hypothetical protein ACQVP2_07570 [Methylobacterium aquaticum]|uniref:hypothetical protein n=1 Tax=Methylobacterium aquaticum TaxID=270351 RepID=UPI003D16B9F0